jgi:hypothetical protein
VEQQQQFYSAAPPQSLDICFSTMPAMSITTSTAFPQQTWKSSEQEMHDRMQPQDDEMDPAAEPNDSSLPTDDQIKAYEALQAAHAKLQQQQLQQQQRRRRRNEGPKVYFAEDALLYSSDRVLEEVQRMWYSREELNEFKNERKHIVKVLKKSNFDVLAVEQSGRYCLRGYEPYFSMEVNKAMKYARTLVTSLVMAEQNRQRALGYLDDEAMRLACFGASQWARDNALQLGSNDEYEAYAEYECYMEDVSNYSCYDEIDFYPTDSQTVGTKDQFETTSYSVNDTLVVSSILGKRKDSDAMELEQPEFSFRTRTPETETNNDHLAERLESALKLVEALRFGTTSSSSS